MASVSFVFLFAAFRGSVFSVSLSDVDVDERGQQRGLGALRDACVRRSGEESEEQRQRRREVFSFFFFSEVCFASAQSAGSKTDLLSHHRSKGKSIVLPRALSCLS
jgi:hypothetical protein